MQYQTLRSVSDNHAHVICRAVDLRRPKPNVWS